MHRHQVVGCSFCVQLTVVKRYEHDAGSDRDNNACFPASASLLVKIGGCLTDFDDDFEEEWDEELPGDADQFEPDEKIEEIAEPIEPDFEDED